MQFEDFEQNTKKEAFTFPDITKEAGEIERVAKQYDPEHAEAFALKFVEKAKQSKLIDMTEEMWSKLENTDSFDISKDGWDKVSEHVDHGNKESGANRDWQDIKQKMEQAVVLDAPIILKRLNELHLVSGNTRLMVARALGKIPKVLLVEMEGIKNKITLDETAEKLKNNLLAYFETLEQAEKEKLTKALDLALELHSDQKDRPDGAYVNHILRVADRVVTDFQIRDTAVVTGALFHDSVEDQAKKLSQMLASENPNERENALLYIQENFGEDAARIVAGVTNSEELDSLEGEERNSAYVEHVVETIQYPKVFYVKLSDFSDNGLNIENVLDVARQKKLAKKYLPLYQIFIDRIRKEDVEIPAEKKQEIEARLISVKQFAERII